MEEDRVHKYHYRTLTKMAGTINWITEPYPDDISDLLLQENEKSCENSEESDIYESDVESDIDDEIF